MSCYFRHFKRSHTFICKITEAKLERKNERIVSLGVEEKWNKTRLEKLEKAVDRAEKDYRESLNKIPSDWGLIRLQVRINCTLFVLSVAYGK